MKNWRQVLWFIAVSVGIACSSPVEEMSDNSSGADDEAEAARLDGMGDRLNAAMHQNVGKQSWVPLTRQQLTPKPLEAGAIDSTSDRIAVVAKNSGFFLKTVDVAGTQYVQISMEETGLGGAVGSPALPFRGMYLEVPYGVEVAAEVAGKTTTSTTLTKPVYPLQPSTVDSMAAPPFEKDEDAYGQNRFYPENIVRIENDGFIRGRRTIFLEISPVQYNPVTGELLVHSDIAIDVNLMGKPDTTEDMNRDRLRSDAFEQQAERLIENYSQIVAFPTRVAAPVLTAAEAPENAADYLIITADSFAEEVAPLAEWKRQKGYITKVVPLSDIGTTATDIDNYIQVAYDTWAPAPTYVLLVGDVADMPSYPDTTTISDLEYSKTDGTDDWPDVVVGRLSVSTEAECTTVVNKILNYDRTPAPGSWYANSLAAAYFQDYDDYDCKADRFFLETAVHAYEYLRDVQGQTVHSSFVNGNTCSTYTYKTDESYYPHRPAHPATVPPYIVSQFRSGTAATQAITSAINNGVGLVVHRDHGGELGWGDPDYDVNDVRTLSNGTMTPVVLSINCLTGAFDYSSDSFAEVFQTHAAGGAVGVIAAVRVSYSGHNDNFANGLMTAFWPDFDPSHPTTAYPNSFRVAEAMNFAKHFMYTYHGDTSTTRTEFRLFHWFGDPEMEYRPVSPAVLPIVVPDGISPEDTEVVVGGAPDGAIVGITQSGEVLGRAVSAGGNVVVPIAALVDDTTPLLITVTNHDMMPFQAEVQLSAIELDLPATVTEGDGVLQDAGTVTLPEPAALDEVISLSVSDASELQVPATVIIPAGQTSASFDITVLDDSELDIFVDVTVTAFNAIFGTRDSHIAVLDNESASISVNFAGNLTEGMGTVANHGVIAISDVVTRDVAFQMTSDDESEILLPATVTVPAGTSSVAFDVTVVDDILLDGDQTVTVNAGVSGWSGGSGNITVVDNETVAPALTVSIPRRGWEGAVLAGAGRVIIPAPLFEDLTVTLSSGDDTEATVPPSVTISAGNTEQEFDIALIDDGIPDGNQTATITASATGWQTASAPITVIETLSLPYSQDFSAGIPDDTEGFEYYSSNTYGRIQNFNGSLLMDSATDLNYALNEATLTLDMRGFENIVLEFDQTIYADEADSLALKFTGHQSGDGVSISDDGNTWYTIVNASALASTGSHTVMLDNEVARIQGSYDPNFGYSESFHIRFQQYDDYAYSTDGRAWDNIAVYGDTQMTLTLPAEATEGDGVLSGAGMVAFDTPVANDTVVSLSSSDASEVTVPASVLIPAGQTSATFDIAVMDDPIADGSQQVSIMANSNVSAAMLVHDNEAANVYVDIIPATVSESDGVLVGQGVITLDSIAAEAVSIALSSDTPQELTVPATVTIPAGSSSVAFNLTIIDDVYLDGDQTVVISASVTGWTGSSDSVVVRDNERFELLLSFPSPVTEGDGVLTAAGTVSLQGIAMNDVVVTLSSGDTSEITVPASVTIPAGQTEASFNITVVDDTAADGPQSVPLNATATGFIGVLASIVVGDDELSGFVIGPIAIDQYAGAPFAVEITAVDISGTIIDNCSGTASLSAAGDGGVLSLTPTRVMFVDGVWSGTVSIDAVDTNVTLQADNGAGIVATSNGFDVSVGMVTEFFFSDMSDQKVNVPFDVTVSAVDAFGNVNPDYNGTVTLTGNRPGGGSIVITEASTEPDFLEIQNVTDNTVDTSGWIVAVSNDYSNPSLVNSVTWSLPGTMAPGEILYRTDSSSTSSTYWGSNIYWNPGSGGWVMILDDNRNVVDMVVWIYTESQISTMAPVIGGQVISVGDAFVGGGITQYSSTISYQREGDADNNDAADWFISTPSNLGTQNPGLAFPFGSSSVAIYPTAITFVDGIWNGDVTVLETAENMTLSANDGAVITGAGDAFNVTSDLLSLSVPAVATEGEGVLVNGGRVVLSAAQPVDIYVTLSSSDTTEVTVPTTVVIPPGELWVDFDVTVVDDAELDGAQQVTLMANAAGWPTATDTMTINDNDTGYLVMDITPTEATEGDGILVGAGMVAISQSMDVDVAVSLTASLPDELSVPSTVVIPAGQTTAFFDITILDDSELDGTQLVDIAATAPGFMSDMDSISVLDNDVDHFEMVTVIPNQQDGVPFNMEIHAMDASGTVQGSFTGTVSLSGTGDSGAVTVSPSGITFVNGVWAGSVTVSTVDTNVVLSVDDGLGHAGSSNSFNVVGGGSDISALFTVSNDWGAGYCVTLNVTNSAGSPTTNWTVTLNTRGTDIYTQWNGNFSGTNGLVTVTPAGWNNIIYPGATDTSIGFCANRTAGGSELPVVESTSGTY